MGVSNPITLPVMSSFRVNGRWSEPTSFAFSDVGESWGSGQATISPGIDLWGIAGHLQEASLPCGALLFDDSLPMMMQEPESSSEPLYACSSSVTTVTAGMSGGSVGKPIVFTATVAPATGSSIMPTGEVAWSVNGNSIGSCTISGASSCTVSYTPSTSGQYAVSAIYLGDSNYAGDTGISTFTVATDSGA